MNKDRQQPAMAMAVEAHSQHCSHAKSFAIQSSRWLQHAPSADTYLRSAVSAVLCYNRFTVPNRDVSAVL